MSSKWIYIVEDDKNIREMEQYALENSGFQVKGFDDGKSFFKGCEETLPGLIILDIMLPDMDGYTILRRIREADERVPVIIVSAKSDEISFVKGLNKGADDYMSKPFSILELMARVRARLRVANLNISASGGFRIDRNTYKVFYDGTDLGLTLKEYRLLDQLISKAGVTVAREDLFREVWGDDYMGETRTLDMHIATLREKIKAAGGGDPIVTVRGIGYRFEG